MDNYQLSEEIFEEEIPNPNLYITLSSRGYLWSADVSPWQEISPWTFSQGQ